MLNMVIFAVLIMVLLALVILIIVLLAAAKKHNITLHLKEPVNNNFIYYKRKAKLFKDKEGQEFYKTNKKINGKKFFPIPQTNKCIHLDDKGKKHVFCYVSGHGEIVYSIDENSDLFTSKQFLEKIEPFTSNQRALFVNQYRKSLEDAGFNWKENLPLIVGAITLVIIMVMSMVVVKDLYSNNKKTQEMNFKITEKQGEIIADYADINNGIQEIRQELHVQNEETGGAVP